MLCPLGQDQDLAACGECSCHLVGNLGRDPEVRSFQNGGKVCNLNVACSERWKDKNSGEMKEKTEWITVAVFAEHAVRYAEQYLRKGSKVYVEGKIETRKWQDQNGLDRYSTEVTVRPYGGELQGLDPRQGDSRQQSGNQPQGGGYGGNPASDIDDEVPFFREDRI